ncbi:uncharacterized protein LOC118735443 isoform X1 [Rhagoletis pomonella]|uniref:uncharacterized protein LOC118735443 isoform X1 n=2 Tax=Rhagoletis pomonella TaxID=28610 RepID=UPI00177B0D13|nr:uncharacterized protein LOC118735443 isoform X1 [Rhagoletis pomonella]
MLVRLQNPNHGELCTSTRVLSNPAQNEIAIVMRVPDITLTAGNAAKFTHNRNKLNDPNTDQQQTLTSTTEKSLSPIQSQRGELNKNANWTASQLNNATTNTTGLCDYLPSAQHFNTPSVYTSSADEFVQRALSSSLAVPYEYNNSSLATSGFEEYFQRSTQNATQNYLDGFGSNSNSAYGGFQEVYVNRAAIALDDYENNTTNRSTKSGNFVGVNNSGEQHYDSYSLRASRGVRPAGCQFDYNNDMKKEVSNTIFEQNSNHQQSSKTKVVKGEYLGDAKDIDFDYNDQSMVDLCHDRRHKSTVEQHNDELDEYLTSPTSSSVSLSTPQRSYFPRGIINPNYPGFQHLAHTLSEHFIGCTPSDSCDSDMSECEMELSADSCEELPSEEQQVELNVKMNTYNNNNNQKRSSSQGSQDTASRNADQKHRQQSNLIAYTDDNSNSASTDHPATNEDQQHKYQQEQHSKLGTLIANELHENLRQLLTLNVPDNYSDAYIINSADNFAFRYDQKCRLVAQIYDEGTQVHGTTPDILLKNCNLSVEKLSKKENRPDLLRGVSPQPLRNRIEAADEENTNAINEAIDKPREIMPAEKASGAVANVEHSDATTPVRSGGEICKDDAVGFGITPVDIIGDFEQEVEREFGLLVSGYRRLVETNDEANEEVDEVGEPQPIEKVSDAMLSSAKDLIDSDRYVTALQQKGKEDLYAKVETRTDAAAANKTDGTQAPLMDFMEDNNAVDWSYGRGSDSEEVNITQVKEAHDSKLDDITDVSTVSNTSSRPEIRPKYQKASYDERQLPPVTIEYKRCQQSTRNTRKSTGQSHENRTEKATKATSGSKIGRNHSKNPFANRFFSSKRSSGGGGGSGGARNGDRSADSNASRRREEAEMHQYQQLISNKELISSNSRYAKMSVWAQYLKNSVENHGGKYAGTDLASPSALELFDAYKIGGDFDMETLQQHLKMAKEIEKKRRSDREEIRRRLAMGSEEVSQESKERNAWKTGIQSRLASAQLGRLNEPSSDTESHSSDSETCPKLSKTKYNVDNASAVSISLADKPTYPYAGSGRASISSHGTIAAGKQQNLQKTLSAISIEDMECDFFTKQAKLQIEARMALAQAKEMAHMQMEIERQNRRVSPITDIIRVSLRKVGVQMTADKRRVSRQMLTDMNIAQLQVLVNSLHTHIEELNESLVHNLMERDDLHVSQDSMLADIEELTRYIGASEHLAQRYKNQNPFNHN